MNIDYTYTSMEQIERLWLLLEQTAQGPDESGDGFTTHHRVCGCGKALGECFEVHGGLRLMEHEPVLYMEAHAGMIGFPVFDNDECAGYAIVEPYEPRLSKVWDRRWTETVAYHRANGSVDGENAIHYQASRDQLAARRYDSNTEAEDRAGDAWDREVDSWFDIDGGDRWTSPAEDEDHWEPISAFLWYGEQMALIGETDQEEDEIYRNLHEPF